MDTAEATVRTRRSRTPAAEDGRKMDDRRRGTRTHSWRYSGIRQTRLHRTRNTAYRKGDRRLPAWKIDNRDGGVPTKLGKAICGRKDCRGSETTFRRMRNRKGPPREHSYVTEHVFGPFEATRIVTNEKKGTRLANDSHGVNTIS